MKEIETEDDLMLMTQLFYGKLMADESINFIFTDIVKIKIEAHFPIVVQFWAQVVLDKGGYSNNLTQIHLDIDTKYHLSKEIFEKWLFYFDETVDELFVGDKARKLKDQAHNLSILMQIKINQKNR